MHASAPRRTPLFAGEPIAELRGLAALTDPDDDVAAVIDLAAIGARGDGKTQFLVHAIRALHARSPALTGQEEELNHGIMRLVLDPRAPRPDATPPGVVPHFTFRVRAVTVFDRLAWPSALRLATRLGGVTALVALATALVVVGVGVAIARALPVGIIVTASGGVLAGIAALVARRRIERAGDIEITFWDVAGEQVYSPAAADYHALLGKLVEARRARADTRGRAYAFAPVLICNPTALGTLEEGSPYARLRALLPLFAALDREASRALIAVNRWSVVEHICRAGAPRDEVVTVKTHARGGAPASEQRVAREHVRVHCLDAEDGHDGQVAISHVRYDTAIQSTVTAGDDGTLHYDYDEGPGALAGTAHRRFLAWLTSLPRWSRPRAPEPEPAPQAAAEVQPVPVPVAAPELWARPRPR